LILVKKNLVLGTPFITYYRFIFPKTRIKNEIDIALVAFLDLDSKHRFFRVVGDDGLKAIQPRFYR
jgi:hypothetical protein